MLSLNQLKQSVTNSPAMVFDSDGISHNLAALADLRQQSGCKVLYSIKALPLFEVLDLVKPYVNGFSVSSLFEARLAQECLCRTGSVHLTTPGVRQPEADELGRLCSHISANSLIQYGYFSHAPASLGIRINPELSFAADSRYDPCRPNSKLGVPMESLRQSNLLAKIKGLHFHTMFAAHAYQPLLATVNKLRLLLDDERVHLEWLNLGGGYWYGKIAENQEFIKMINSLTTDYDLEIFIEPGNAIVGDTGYLMATVIDLFTSGDKQVAVLDTSVNHLPEVFEYQRKPDLAEHNPEADCAVLLAGSTCLAGDIFGEYRFGKPLEIGERVVFRNTGAYTLVKAQRFNGYNLPDIYLHQSGDYRHIKSYTYPDYRRHWLNDEKSIRS